MTGPRRYRLFLSERGRQRRHDRSESVNASPFMTASAIGVLHDPAVRRDLDQPGSSGKGPFEAPRTGCQFLALGGVSDGIFQWTAMLAVATAKPSA